VRHVPDDLQSGGTPGAPAPRPHHPSSEREKGGQDARAPGAVLIAGPTASGKSALALAVAERIGGVIINTDSMQVYRDLSIITARPGADETARVPHLLYGHVDAAENYSAGRFVDDAAAALVQVRAQGRIPVFTGGSGLYFKALIAGLAAIPPVPPEIRAGVRARLEACGPGALHEELARHDPAAAAQLRPADRTRIARALEVVKATGRSITEWRHDGLPPLLDAARVAKMFLAPDRAVLYRRIDARFDVMLSAGALDEVRLLSARGLDPLLPAMKAHGVPWLIRHLAGEMSLAAAAEEAKKDTRHYAKRQFTWFRHQLGDWPQADPADACDALMRELEP
jgi:tRNA dimethylallyltransferase